MCDEDETSTPATIRVITIRSNRQNTPTSPSAVSNSGDNTPCRDSDPESPYDDDSYVSVKIEKFLGSSISVGELIDQTSYLQQYPSWLGFCGPENKKKFAPTYINRNDNIWELVFSERGYVDMLLIVRDLYMIPFPKIDAHSINGLSTDSVLGNSSDLCTALFPCINELVKSHEKIFRVLAGLHVEREDHVVSSLGAYLVKLFDADSLSSLSQLYGQFLFAQKRIRQRLQLCKSHPQIASFFQQVKQNPRSSRKSLEDCYMVIVQRWTKVETLLESIIRNTLNDDKEVANLEISRNAVKSLIKAAESILTEFEHAEKLSEIANRLEVPTSMMTIITSSANSSHTTSSASSSSSSSSSPEIQLLNELKSPNTKLINHGPLFAIPMVAGGGQQSTASYEVEGVALENCFFMLRKVPDSNRYQLFRGTEMPPILWWGKVYGYFRKSMEKGSFGFYILLHSATALTLFRCATVDELARWETVFNDGFAQWREQADTFESLSEEFSKARDEISEKQKRTEGILELLHQLNENRLKFWHIWEFVASSLITERLAEMNVVTANTLLNQQKQQSALSLTPHSASRRSTKADLPASATTNNTTSNNNNNNSNAEYVVTMDTLKLNTFISNLDAYNELDQLFHLLHEYYHRLSFALLSGPSSNLSRSASDVDGSKRPPANPVKKHETFSAHDNVPEGSIEEFLTELSTELRSSIDVGHMKSKKRDVHRLSATMASIFRTPSRDKNLSSTNQSSTDHTSNGTCTNTPGGGLKSIKQRQPGSTTPSQSNGPPLPPRPSFAVLSNLNLTGVGEQLSPTNQCSFNTDSLTDGTNSLALSQPCAEALVLLGELNRIGEALFPQVQLLRTENVELRATLAKLEAERSNWEHFRSRDNQVLMRSTLGGGGASSSSQGSGTHPDGNTGGSSGVYLIDNSTVKQETEKLRQDYENFTRKCHEWEKEYQKQRSAIEREHNKIAKERQLIENERADLERRHHQYEELRSTLQTQLNMYKKLGFKLTPMNNPELEALANLESDMNNDGVNGFQLNRSSSSVITNSFDDYLNELSGNTAHNSSGRGGGGDLPQPIHFYSNSDDITASRRSSNTSFNTGQKRDYAYSPGTDITPKPSLVPSLSTRSDHVPEHLLGSLVNQPNSSRSSDYRSDYNPTNSNDRLLSGSSSIGTSSNNTSGKSISGSSLFSDSNPLMKLVDHTKVKSSSSLSKPLKKSYRSRSRQQKDS
uniref:DH domain-containing protein n=1 Tax=Trichobilharzia regenti TaxID=157069 RepID=A0AA85IPV5_TRIRE|nr:unnamed protein product [Trichobilharzia regenti]